MQLYRVATLAVAFVNSAKQVGMGGDNHYVDQLSRAHTKRLDFMPLQDHADPNHRRYSSHSDVASPSQSTSRGSEKHTRSILNKTFHPFDPSKKPEKHYEGPASYHAPEDKRESSDTESQVQIEPAKKVERPKLDPSLQGVLALRWPFQGGPGSITLTLGDIERLHDGEFLNDSLIEYGLRRITDQLALSDPILREHIHVMNPYLYVRLRRAFLNTSNRNAIIERDSVQVEIPQAEYNLCEMVYKWTSKIDIFAKKFIFIPVNEDLHWYLAVISNPRECIEPTENGKCQIFIMDSLGFQRSTTLNRLKTYLKAEARVKKNVVTHVRMHGKHITVPRQLNDYDCGPYLLHYVDLLLKHIPQFEEYLAGQKPNSSHSPAPFWRDEDPYQRRKKLRAMVDKDMTDFKSYLDSTCPTDISGLNTIQLDSNGKESTAPSEVSHSPNEPESAASPHAQGIPPDMQTDSSLNSPKETGEPQQNLTDSNQALDITLDDHEEPKSAMESEASNAQQGDQSDSDDSVIFEVPSNARTSRTSQNSLLDEQHKIPPPPKILPPPAWWDESKPMPKNVVPFGYDPAAVDLTRKKGARRNLNHLVQPIRHSPRTTTQEKREEVNSKVALREAKARQRESNWASLFSLPQHKNSESVEVVDNGSSLKASRETPKSELKDASNPSTVNISDDELTIDTALSKLPKRQESSPSPPRTPKRQKQTATPQTNSSPRRPSFFSQRSAKKGE